MGHLWLANRQQWWCQWWYGLCDLGSFRFLWDWKSKWYNDPEFQMLCIRQNSYIYLGHSWIYTYCYSKKWPIGLRSAVCQPQHKPAGLTLVKSLHTKTMIHGARYPLSFQTRTFILDLCQTEIQKFVSVLWHIFCWQAETHGAHACRLSPTVQTHVTKFWKSKWSTDQVVVYLTHQIHLLLSLVGANM